MNLSIPNYQLVNKYCNLHTICRNTSKVIYKQEVQNKNISSRVSNSGMVPKRWWWVEFSKTVFKPSDFRNPEDLSTKRHKRNNLAHSLLRQHRHMTKLKTNPSRSNQTWHGDLSIHKLPWEIWMVISITLFSIFFMLFNFFPS